MTAIRTFATFAWGRSEPDRLGPSGEVDEPGGKNIMEALRQLMSQRGFKVSGVEPHDAYGWYFETAADEFNVWSMLQFSEPWLLISEVKLGLFQRLKGVATEPALTKVCPALNECLRALPEASAIQWFTRDEFQRQRGEGGAAHP